MWPFLGESLISHCAVCWNLLEYSVTSNVSLNLTLAVLVKVPFTRKWNQPVTNGRYYVSYLVGTSETTRATSFDHCNFPSVSGIKLVEKDTRFNQWLAGLIDGDGTLQVSKAGYSSCEITVSLADERMLRIIQNKLGGAIKARSGVKAIRWRLHNRPGMIDLVNRVNGYIRHSGRLVQLNQVCAKLGLQLLSPDNLHLEHGWFSGFFDASGAIIYSLKDSNLNHSVTLSVTNKNYTELSFFSTFFGGAIFFDSGRNGYYRWCLQLSPKGFPKGLPNGSPKGSPKGRDELFSFVNYIKTCPLRSVKGNRFFLIKNYFFLVDLEAHKAPAGTILNKA